MLKSQIAKLNMYRAVRDVLSSHQNDWAGIPAFGTAFTAFNDSLSQLIIKGQEQKEVITGITRNKHQVIEEAVAKALKMKNALKTFAAVNNDIILLEKVDFGKTYLRKGAQITILGRVSRILQLAQEHETALEAFGITAADIQDFQTKVAAMQQLLVAPRLAIVGRKQITSEIHELVRTLDDLIEFQLDPMVKVLKDTAPEFSRLYFDARIVIEFGHRTSGTDFHPDDGAPEEPDDGLGAA